MTGKSYHSAPCLVWKLFCWQQHCVLTLSITLGQANSKQTVLIAGHERLHSAACEQIPASEASLDGMIEHQHIYTVGP